MLVLTQVWAARAGSHLMSAAAQVLKNCVCAGDCLARSKRSLYAHNPRTQRIITPKKSGRKKMQRQIYTNVLRLLNS